MSQISPTKNHYHWHPIPPSQNNTTCTLHLLQAGSIKIPKHLVLLPPSPSSSSKEEEEEDTHFLAPDYCFLLHHPPTNTSYIFDLGIRKDLSNLPPYLIHNTLPNFPCYPKSPADILRQHGSPAQQPENVKAVIFSHMHFDHVGDGAKTGFTNAEIWVGPTCCTYARPGYPVEKDAPTLSETLPVDGSRRIVEVFISDEEFERTGDARAGKVRKAKVEGLYEGVDLRVGVGAFERGFDYFGDGSAFLIDAPGHAAGHLEMLVRVKVNGDGEEDDFALLAGDCYHHPELMKDPQRTARPPFSKGSMHTDPEVAIDTMARTKAFYEKENVLVAGAHDFSVGEAIVSGKEEIEGLVCLNEWRSKGWGKGIA
ncbi:hypothetical protein DM02DRAFT_597228 [Periconia macrospinosa]|uniref:Metallo-beta-lactamase domain-containing protein n=1 Tax=Periconia macrospinosa TaxID=97972 RepID=A0A2V1DID7_9PLEO|nr:hypothetical protein DM02DRAFT_597228 [Periconia macrospinosa]